jgi:thioredoxin 1
MMIKRFSVLVLAIVFLTLLGGQTSCSTSTAPKTDTNVVVNNPPPITEIQTTLPPESQPPVIPEAQKGTFAQEIAAYGKPVMVDFGLETCIPCKMMIPVMEELKSKFPQDLKTIFVQVQQEQNKSQEFGIRTIPTQIFFDATGKQLELHVGFISTQDILAMFKKYGIAIMK